MGASGRREKWFDEPHIWRVFHRRGTVQILLFLEHAPGSRYSEINSALPNISRQILVNRLGDLRETGMIDRTVEAGPPLVSRYSLTAPGRHLAKAAAVLDEVAQRTDLPNLAA